MTGRKTAGVKETRHRQRWPHHDSASATRNARPVPDHAAIESRHGCSESGFGDPMPGHPRVLHISQPTSEGVARCIEYLAHWQVDLGWNVFLACPATGELPVRARSSGVNVCRWDATRDPLRGLLGELRGLRAIISAVQPDVVHLHSSKAGLIGRMVHHRGVVVFHPNGWSFHAVSGRTRSTAATWERFAARRTDAVICVSESERRLADALAIRGNLVVIPNGIDVSTITRPTKHDRLSARRRLGMNAGHAAVCVGRICRQKGQDVLLDAWRTVRSAVPDAEVFMVGDGPDRERLERAAPPGVRFVGYSTDVPAWLVAADLVVLPSRWEGDSFATLEALAHVRPVIMTDVSGAREIIGNDAGAVVDVEDSVSLAREIIARFRDPSRCVFEGRTGRTRVETERNPRAATSAVVDLYRSLLVGQSSWPVYLANPSQRAPRHAGGLEETPSIDSRG
jgi:glycosyltransferase involved in cell wall biosynthesis